MLAKPAGMKPRDLAEKLIAALPADKAIDKVEIAGPGFINFFQASDWLTELLDAALADEHLAVAVPMWRRPWWWTTPPPTWPRCTSATCAPPSSVMRWCARWNSWVTRSFARIMWAT